MSIADRLVQRFGDRVAYVPALGPLVYDPRRGYWTSQKGLATDCVAAIVNEMSYDPTVLEEFIDEKRKLKKSTKDTYFRHRGSLAALRTITDCLEHIPESYKDLDLFDNKYGFLNTPNGVMNLLAGKLEEHKAEDYMTKVTKGRWDGNLGPLMRTSDEWLGESLWSKVIYEILQGDIEMCLFLQRLLGYALLGNNPLRILAFFYGSGANGKSLIVNALGELLGDYHTVIRSEYLMATRDGGLAPASQLSAFAEIRGARLLTAMELKKGGRWDEAALKDITGGDKMQAKFMHKDQFSFKPQAFLIIPGNHKPELSGTDKAAWQRFLTVSFEADFENDPALRARRDDLLPLKLREADVQASMMGWLARGAVEYAKIGLREPEKVKLFKEAYRAEMNPFGTFLNECFLPFEKVAPEGSEEWPPAVVVSQTTTFEDIMRVLEKWMENNPEFNYLQDKVYSTFRNRVAKRLTSAGVRKTDVWLPDSKRSSRRYFIIPTDQWKHVLVGQSLVVLKNGVEDPGANLEVIPSKD